MPRQQQSFCLLVIQGWVGEAALPGIRAACLDVPLPASLTRANGANGES